MKGIDEARNYFIEETNQNEFKGKKPKKVCATLNYIEHLIILTSAVTGYVSISDFASLVGISTDIKSSTLGLKIYPITAGIKKVIKKKKKKKEHDKIIFQEKLSTLKVLISRGLIDSYISRDRFVLVNKMLREYDDMKEETKNLKNSIAHKKF